MDKLKQWLRPFLNFYVVVGVVALVWMVFFDLNSVVGRIERSKRITQMEQDLAHYRSEKDRLLESRMMLESNHEELERYARERYRMKKEDEDLFIIVDAKQE